MKEVLSEIAGAIIPSSPNELKGAIIGGLVGITLSGAGVLALEHREDSKHDTRPVLTKEVSHRSDVGLDLGLISTWTVLSAYAGGIFGNARDSDNAQKARSKQITLSSLGN